MLLAALAACAHTDTDTEEALALPRYPAELAEFRVSDPAGMRFFVDPASLHVGRDGIVRYTLVARAPGGAHNVSYEGMRCATGEVRIYALARDRDWIVRPGAWRTIQAGAAQRWHEALFRDFCPLKRPAASAQEALQALLRVPFDLQ